VLGQFDLFGRKATIRRKQIELSEKEIEKRLRELRQDPSLAREPADQGRFSLAGAQAKTAFQKADGNGFYLRVRSHFAHLETAAA